MCSSSSRFVLRRQILGRMLAETMANLEQAMPVGTIAVVPVPLYTRKQAQRGFNQAEMIARAR